MENLVITWRELIIAAIVVLAVYIAEVLLLVRSSRRPGVRIWQRGALVSSQQQELNRQQEELTQLRVQVGNLQARLEQLEKSAQAQSAAAPSSPYAQAIQLAQQGLDANLVAARCGISRGEAELIVAMHAPGH